VLQPSAQKEATSKPQGLVIWLIGLSGSGKSTLSNLLNETLSREGLRTVMLDGDLMRATINSDLGYSDDDRRENIRRSAQIARMFCQSDTVVIASFITPLREFREMVRKIIGKERLIDVYLRCDYDTCASRDVKGLYAKAQKNAIQHFTGKDSVFEEPVQCELTLNTADESPLQSLDKLIPRIKDRLSRLARPISKPVP